MRALRPGVDLDVLHGFESALHQVQSKETRSVKWFDLRAVKSGVSTFVDVTLIMRGFTNLMEASVEDKVRDALVEAHKGVSPRRYARADPVKCCLHSLLCFDIPAGQ